MCWRVSVGSAYYVTRQYTNGVTILQAAVWYIPVLCAAAGGGVTQCTAGVKRILQQQLVLITGQCV